MKKKGLIISTVVMVIVLIASLTTATYAWFSSSAAAKVNDIQLNVGAASQVQIGVGSGTSPTGYRYGDVTYASNAWADGSQGLGTQINTGFVMNVSKGVGSGTIVDGEKKIDKNYDPTHTLYTASGDTFNVEELVVGDPAIINAEKAGNTEKLTDVVDLNMGLRIVQEGVFGTYCKITVKPTDGQTFIGMAAALRFEITVDGTSVFAGDLFDKLATPLHFDDEATATDGYVFYFMINPLQSSAYAFGTSSSTTITELGIKFFISGYDQDCCNGATGTGATISLDFEACDKADWTATTGWTNLGA